MRVEPFAVPDGFTARRTAAGVILVAPEMHIRCSERVRPICHPAAILGAVGRPVEPMTTCEGELALRTGDCGADAARELGMVIGDDFCTIFLGATSAPREQPGLARIIDGLTHDCRLHLGVRRRRFLFDPPPGWQGFSIDGFDAHYLAPGHPRSVGVVTVHAAVPAVPSLAEWWDDAAQLTGAAASFSPVPIVDELLTGPEHLAGRRIRIAGHAGDRALLAELTCLADRDYWYPIVLVSEPQAMPERAAAVASIIRSIRPLTRGVATAQSLAAFQHWFR